MKKIITGISTIALALTLAACGESGPDMNAAKESAIEACTEAVKENAKYPAAAELVDPIEGAVRPTEDNQGPSGTAYYSVNLGAATFVNGFNVPSEYSYGCVSYHGEDGEVINTQADAREKGVLSNFSYVPSRDELQ